MNMKLTPDNGYLLTSDNLGFIKSYTYNEAGSESLKKDKVKLLTHGVSCITVSGDGRFLFTYDIKGNFKQFFVHDLELYTDHGCIHDKGKIVCMVCTMDGEYLYFADDKGNLVQININPNAEDESIRGQ